MPTRPPARSLLALALVAGLLAASATTASFGEDGPATASTQLRPAAAQPVVAHPAPGTVSTSVPVAPADRVAATRVDWISRSRPNVPEPKAKSVSKTSPARSASAASTTFKGRNHVWIPALGIDRSISSFSCSSSAYPGNRVYRWGCAGSNNVYLFGHAHSVFKPLHDAYVRGRLSKGMKVHYANGGGKVSTYAVSWWKVTTPDKGEWAYVSQSRPSLTLQTCVGAKSQYRLVVRLAKVG